MTGREWRAVSAGGVLIVLAVGILRLVPAGWHRVQLLRERAELTRQLVARQEAELDDLAALEARSDTLRRAVIALADRLVSGTTEAEAQAELLAGIEAAAGRGSAKIGQLEPMPDSIGFGQLRRVQARASLTSDLAGLLDAVKAIEWGPRLMLIRRLRFEVAPDLSAAEPVRADLLIEGWYLRREAAE